MDTTLKFAGYIRVSRVNGRAGDSFISPDLQRESIEKTARQHGLTLAEIVKELDVSGGKDAGTRKLGDLVQDVKDGKLGGVIVWNVKRYSRAWLDGLTVFDSIVGAGGRLIAEDFSFEGLFARSVLSFLLEGAQEERRQKTETWDRSVAGSIARGIHSGSVPPLGFDWPRKADGKKAGPLQPTADAARVLAGFEAFANGATWRETVEILGVKSQGGARTLLTNRVYLGEAYSGEHCKPGAHKSLVTPELFARVARRLDSGRRVNDPAPKRGNEKSLLAGVLHCGCDACAGAKALTWDASSGPAYRRKSLAGGGHATINAAAVEPVVLGLAIGWHHVHQPLFALGRSVDEAVIPEREAEVARRGSDVAEIESAASLTVTQRIALLGPANTALETARALLDEAETAGGVLSLTPERFAAKLAACTVEEKRAAIKELVSVVVRPVGRGYRGTVEGRLQVTYLEGGKRADETPKLADTSHAVFAVA
jgi:hypothetical protein